jgi:hypothetical protein
MGVTGATGPVMDRDEVDRALARLGAEHEAIETSLLALQDHAGRRLLEGADLTGTTEERWTSADASITLLWAYFDAYSDTYRSARDIRSRRRWSSREDLVELTELLRGECVTVAGSAAATANAPTLHGTGKLSHQYSLAALVERMNELYATSLDMVVTADAVWSALPARIDLLAAELQRTRQLAHSVGVRPGEHPAGDDLERITRTLTALRERVISDPLAFWLPAQGSSAPGGGRPDTTVYDREARALEDVRREIDAVLTVRQELIEENRAMVQDLVNQIQGSGLWLDENPANRVKAVGIASGRDFFNQDPKILQYVMDNPGDRVTYGDLRMIREEFEDLMQLSIEAGTIKHPIAYEKYIDDSFVRATKAATIPL